VPVQASAGITLFARYLALAVAVEHKATRPQHVLGFPGLAPAAT
jgi:hypothetical protein